MSEPVDWTKDRFGQGIPAGITYDKLRDTSNFNPIEGESLHSFTERLYHWIKQYETINLNAHVHGRKVWYTHRNPTNCWLCDYITISWKLHETLIDIRETLPNSGKQHRFINGKLVEDIT